MNKKFFLAAACLLAAFAFTGCSTTGSEDGRSGTLVEDASGMGGDVQVGLDPDGAVTVTGTDGYGSNFNGPEALRENNTIYFNYDSDQIHDNYVGVMQAHAKYLRENPDAHIIIEGHTDERGTPEYNIALGERRARAVARYMQNLGVDVNQLSIVSYGEEKPLVVGHNENAWAKNRRAVINY